MAQQQQDRRQVQLAERQQQESPHPMPDPHPQDLEVEQHPREGDTNPFWPPNWVCVTIFLTVCIGIFFRICEWEHCAKGDESAVKAQTKPPNEQEKQKKWLSITASRKEKWWYSTFDNVTALVGAGVLGLPYAMSQLGWYPGVPAILVSWVVGFYSRWQLVEMLRMVLGKQFNRFFNLVKTQQLMVRVASTINIVYCVIGGKSLKRFCYLIRPTLHMHSQTYFCWNIKDCSSSMLCRKQKLNNRRREKLERIRIV